jgi:CheY-like chemotaxis protein
MPAIRFPFQSTLVVDDDAICCALAAHLMTGLGCPQVQSASDGSQGLHLLQHMQPPPDLMLCDIFMPEKDGIEFVMDLARLRYPGGLILITGGDTSMLDAAAGIATASGLRLLGTLQKPLLESALLAALQSH